MNRKSLLICNLIMLLTLFIFFVPHNNYAKSFSWTDSTSVITSVPKGSYNITVTLQGARDNDTLSVTSPQRISSIYSTSCSATLSKYGTNYTIPFETYNQVTDISLAYSPCETEHSVTDSLQIDSIHIESTPLMALQMIGVFFLIAIPLNLIIIFWKTLDKKKWAFLLFTATVASLPLFCGYIFYGHDTLFHLSRVEGLKSGLLAGQFPVRISADQFNQYGYISSAMYPELLLYFPAILRLCNFSIPATYGIFWFCINLLTAYISWTSFQNLTNHKAAAYAGCFIFTLLPYRLLSIYLRGAYGEALALTFFPLILWGVYEIFYGNYKKWPIAVIGYSGVLQCHILTITSTVLLSVAFGLCSFRALFKKKQRLLCVLALVVSVLFINFWFIVPFLMLYRLPIWVKYMDNNFLDHVLYPRQLFELFLSGSGNSYPLSEGPSADMPFSIGGGLMIGLLLIGICFSKKYFSEKRHRNLCLTLLGISTILYWSTTTLFPWATINRAFPFFSSFISNLPWRKLGLAALFLTGAVVVSLSQYSKKWQTKLVLLICAGTLLSSGSFLLSFMHKNGPYITSNEMYGKGSEDELYLYFGTDLDTLKNRGVLVETSDSAILIKDYQKQYTNIQLHYTNPSPLDGWIEVPLNYYPGYIAYDESGRELVVTPGNNNILRVTIPANSESLIAISYTNCTMYRLATAISAFYLLLLLILFLYQKRTSAPHILRKR